MCPGCYVHGGFAEAYSELRPEAFAAFQDLGCSSLALTGHSLGAGLATLAALDARQVLGVPTWPVYLFGAPPVGNAAFHQTFSEVAGWRSAASRSGSSNVPPAWRVVHYHDPVPRFVQLKGNDYMHVPCEVYYYKEDESAYRICQGNDDPQCSSGTSLLQCLSGDHLRYLNISLSLRGLPVECVGHHPPFIFSLPAVLVLCLLSLLALCCCCFCRIWCTALRRRRNRRSSVGALTEMEASRRGQVVDHLVAAG